VCWEAQFGDFVNGAQIVIDQFIVAAEDNIQVANATTAAQYFHLLRRQMHREVRKPLVVFTPKSLLRSPNAFSRFDEFTSGSFREVLDDPVAATGNLDVEAVETVVVCSGKVAYDVIGERDERDTNVAVVRVEQLYPFPHERIRDVLAGYPKATDVVWAQEEPENMGPWGFMRPRLEAILDELDDGRGLRWAARVASASPAAGQHVVHDQEREQLLGDVFDR
jgi:2-oxoglutarate dehydrogenase complex dehydrogenase (E1) component-like enzyme